MKQMEPQEKYEKLTQAFLLCKEIINAYSLYDLFKKQITNRNAHELSVIIDRMFFDFIVINWAKICGSSREHFHISAIFKDNQFTFAKKNF